ncbi:MAG TPA: hypothetical protein VLH35_07570 [Candidatus Acidoferrales bacterium]|nr:hypothetical protein [Candidatus Acidoferrales bacterium]
MGEFNEQEVSKEKLGVSEAIDRLRLIQQGLAALVVVLHENIQALGDDPDFMDSLVALQEDAERKARDLESEVKRLRGDVKSVKDVLGLENEKRNPAESSH